jgi:hypothetical protein
LFREKKRDAGEKKDQAGDEEEQGAKLDFKTKPLQKLGPR